MRVKEEIVKLNNNLPVEFNREKHKTMTKLKLWHKLLKCSSKGFHQFLNYKWAYKLPGTCEREKVTASDP